MLDRSRILAGQAPWEDRGPDVTVPARAVPCVVTARWEDGSTSEHRATAKAWTPRAVEVVFGAHRGTYRVWLPVADVRRAPEPDNGHQDGVRPARDTACRGGPATAPDDPPPGS